MRAFVYTGRNRVELQEVPIPVPGEDEVVIKVAGCGVCGTDVHIYHGEVPLARPPMVLGHEITGRVYSNITDWIYFGHSDYFPAVFE